MNGFLLDVNILIALAREDHVAHKTVRQWFQRAGSRSWATCALTQAGFVRVIANPRFLEQPPNMSEAIDMLRALTALPGHRFWPIEITFVKAAMALEKNLFGHQQVTDTYLLGLAIQNRGKLATLDKGIADLAGIELARHVEIIR